MHIKRGATVTTTSTPRQTPEKLRLRNDIKQRATSRETSTNQIESWLQLYENEKFRRDPGAVGIRGEGREFYKSDE